MTAAPTNAELAANIEQHARGLPSSIIRDRLKLAAKRLRAAGKLAERAKSVAESDHTFTDDGSENCGCPAVMRAALTTYELEN